MGSHCESWNRRYAADSFSTSEQTLLFSVARGLSCCPPRECVWGGRQAGQGHQSKRNMPTPCSSAASIFLLMTRGTWHRLKHAGRAAAMLRRCCPPTPTHPGTHAARAPFAPLTETQRTFLTWEPPPPPPLHPRAKRSPLRRARMCRPPPVAGSVAGGRGSAACHGWVAGTPSSFCDARCRRGARWVSWMGAF